MKSSVCLLATLQTFTAAYQLPLGHVGAAAPYAILPHAPRHPSIRAVDDETLNAIAIYDSEVEARIQDLNARAQSAEVNAAQNRELVNTAQKQLDEMNELRKKDMAELEAAKEQLEVASSGAKKMAEELAGETRKKEMHHAKAREFFAEAKAAKKEVEELKAELEALRSKAAPKDE